MENYQGPLPNPNPNPENEDNPNKNKGTYQFSMVLKFFLHNITQNILIFR